MCWILISENTQTTCFGLILSKCFSSDLHRQTHDCTTGEEANINCSEVSPTTHVFCSDSAQVASAGWHRRSPQDQSQLWFMRFYSCTQTNGSQLWTQKTLMMLQHLSVCRTERLFAAPSAPPSAPPIVRDEWMFVQQVEEQVVLLQTTWLPNSWAQFTEARESSAPFSNF